MYTAELPPAFSSFSGQPVYNVKAVCQRTGITAATLRAWERRYGLPQPHRSPQGYRVYSERDMAMLFWLLRQTEAGVSIAHAVHQLQALLSSGHDPHITLPASLNASAAGLRSPSILRAEIVDALIAIDEQKAEHLLSEALAMYTLETALITILQSAVQDVRELRLVGKISTTAEHMAVNYVHQRLLNMAQASPIARAGQKVVLTIGFSSEHNELDLLIMSILLRRQGIPVTALGNDLEPHMLEQALDHLNAGVIVFYADDPKNVVRLVGVEMPRRSTNDPIHAVCCGRALEIAPELRTHIPFEYLGSDLRAAIHNIAQHMGTQMSTPTLGNELGETELRENEPRV